ncbi:hypothetical protein GCM10007989_13230 [Devosia pacifica]|uniref:Uncharacterized protein n=1 Tax=Devosia pacifica TaxID=1335967 RepID=A0A918S1S0_9HYPH|nr:hypothetical protein GCM10007989_13230 [Devosia pacifica]
MFGEGVTWSDHVSTDRNDACSLGNPRWSVDTSLPQPLSEIIPRIDVPKAEIVRLNSIEPLLKTLHAVWKAKQLKWMDRMG